MRLPLILLTLLLTACPHSTSSPPRKILLHIDPPMVTVDYVAEAHFSVFIMGYWPDAEYLQITVLETGRQLKGALYWDDEVLGRTYEWDSELITLQEYLIYAHYWDVELRRYDLSGANQWDGVIHLKGELLRANGQPLSPAVLVTVHVTCLRCAA